MRGATIHTTTVVFPYVPSQKFRFIAVSGKGNWLFNLLGDPVVKLNDADLDRDHTFKASNKLKLQSLMSNNSLKALLKAQKNCRYWIQDNPGTAIFNFGRFPNNIALLAFTVPETIDDGARLKRIYDMFATTVDQFVTNNLILDEDPKFVF